VKWYGILRELALQAFGCVGLILALRFMRLN